MNDDLLNSYYTYIHNHVDAHVGHVPGEEDDREVNLEGETEPDDASLLWRDLSVLDQLRQVLLADPVLWLDVQQNDPGWELKSITIIL